LQYNLHLPSFDPKQAGLVSWNFSVTPSWSLIETNMHTILPSLLLYALTAVTTFNLVLAVPFKHSSFPEARIVQPTLGAQIRIDGIKITDHQEVVTGTLARQSGRTQLGVVDAHVDAKNSQFARLHHPVPDNCLFQVFKLDKHGKTIASTHWSGGLAAGDIRSDSGDFDSMWYKLKFRIKRFLKIDKVTCSDFGHKDGY
ncbi:hypothetical protein BDP27DRAFT_1530362, partial [Rhodocollybia butyracea]